MSIVERLRWCSIHGSQEDAIAVQTEAANEIERLLAENAELKAALTMSEARAVREFEARVREFEARAALEPKP